MQKLPTYFPVLGIAVYKNDKGCFLGENPIPKPVYVQLQEAFNAKWVMQSEIREKEGAVFKFFIDRENPKNKLYAKDGAKTTESEFNAAVQRQNEKAC